MNQKMRDNRRVDMIYEWLLKKAIWWMFLPLILFIWFARIAPARELSSGKYADEILANRGFASAELYNMLYRHRSGTRIYYLYEVDGKYYRGVTFSNFSPRDIRKHHPVGSTFPIMYDRTHPEHALPDRDRVSFTDKY